MIIREQGTGIREQGISVSHREESKSFSNQRFENTTIFNFKFSILNCPVPWCLMPHQDGRADVGIGPYESVPRRLMPELEESRSMPIAFPINHTAKIVQMQEHLHRSPS